MTVPGLVFLAGFSARAQCYAQAMARCSLEPEHVILFGNPEKDHPREIPIPPEVCERVAVPLPDLTEPLVATCKRRGWSSEVVASEDVNSDAIFDAVSRAAPRLVVYAATRGQILNNRLVGQNFPILHMHAGWLPEFRGSTTVYYSILKERECAVTAFYITEGIDTGRIVRRDRYPPPPAGLDVDYVYDGALRAETLIRSLQCLTEHETLPKGTVQRHEGEVYYVIHPLLKHIALLSLGAESDMGNEGS